MNPCDRRLPGGLSQIKYYSSKFKEVLIKSGILGKIYSDNKCCFFKYIFTVGNKIHIKIKNKIYGN